MIKNKFNIVFLNHEVNKINIPKDTFLIYRPNYIQGNDSYRRPDRKDCLFVLAWNGKWYCDDEISKE